MESGIELVGTAIINQNQLDVYTKAKWKFQAPPSKVMVLHTLVIDPELNTSYTANQLRPVELTESLQALQYPQAQ